MGSWVRSFDLESFFSVLFRSFRFGSVSFLRFPGFAEEKDGTMTGDGGDRGRVGRYGTQQDMNEGEGRYEGLGSSDLGSLRFYSIRLRIPSLSFLSSRSVFP